MSLALFRHVFPWQLEEEIKLCKFELEHTAETLLKETDKAQLYQLCKSYVDAFERIAILEKQLKEMEKPKAEVTA